jgi:hypothetical protein
MFGSFAKIGRAADLFIISMTKLDTSQCQHHIFSPNYKPSPAMQTINQNLVLLFVFSFSFLIVKATFGALVRIFI